MTWTVHLGGPILGSMTNPTSTESPTLVLGGTGETGRRVVTRLEAMGLPVRVGSRAGTPRFDWNDSATWDAALNGVGAVYIAFHPDLAMPGALEIITAFVLRAQQKGVLKLVLLSGRGEEEAQRCERVVERSGLAWTIVRCSWFNQNFSESMFVELLRSGTVALPAGEVREPFVDADDIADVAVAALTDTRHAGQLYELTGPELLTFADVTTRVSQTTGRDIRYAQVQHTDFLAGLRAAQLPEEIVGMCDYLFATVLDGRNASVCDGVQRALGRPPRRFDDYVRDTAATGCWNR